MREKSSISCRELFAEICLAPQRPVAGTATPFFSACAKTSRKARMQYSYETPCLIDIGFGLRLTDLLWCHASRCLFDEGSNCLRLRYIHSVVGFNLYNGCAGAFGHHPLSIRRDHLVFGGEYEPAGLCFPRRFTDRTDWTLC